MDTELDRPFSCCARKHGQNRARCTSTDLSCVVYGVWTSPGKHGTAWFCFRGQHVVFLAGFRCFLLFSRLSLTELDKEKVVIFGQRSKKTESEKIRFYGFIGSGSVSSFIYAALICPEKYKDFRTLNLGNLRISAGGESLLQTFQSID